MYENNYQSNVITQVDSTHRKAGGSALRKVLYESAFSRADRKEEIFAISFSDTRLYHDCLIVRLCSDVRVDRERSGSNIVRR